MIYASDAMQISDNLYCLGPQMVPAYLLDGETPIMFDAGVYFVGEHYKAELDKILKGRPLSYLFLSHMHFDHCGAAAFLKELYPDLVVCASSEAAEIISKPSALNLIGQLNNIPGLNENQKFKPFGIDRILTDGEQFQLNGGSGITVFATPGHTRDMLSFYLEDEKALIPSEAAGVPTSEGKSYTEFLVDSESYFESQQKLATLEFDTLLFAHSYVFTGEEAKSYFQNALEQGYVFRQHLSDLIDQHGDQTDKIMEIVKKEEYDNAEEPKQLEKAYLLNLDAKIKAVRKWKEKDGI
jgi:2-aminobenzoylacetyl-CoA thioesterase